MQKLKSIVDDAVAELQDVITDDQTDKVSKAIESAVIRGMLEGQHRAVDACIYHSEAEQDTAHKIATAIRKENDMLIANLSSLR